MSKERGTSFIEVLICISLLSILLLNGLRLVEVVKFKPPVFEPSVQSVRCEERADNLGRNCTIRSLPNTEPDGEFTLLY